MSSSASHASHRPPRAPKSPNIVDRSPSVVHNLIIPVLITAAIVLLFNGIFTIAFSEIFEGRFWTEDDLGLASTCSMILTVLVAWVLMRKLSRMTNIQLGFLRKGWGWQYLTGFAGGFVAISVVFIGATLLGALEVTVELSASTVVLFLVSLMFFLFQGMQEELIFRGYLMTNLLALMGPWPAMIISSVAFMFMHGGNDFMGVMSYVNLFLFGLIFAVLFWRTGSIWLVGAGHSAWNFFLGPFYGSHVSGVPAENSFLFANPAPGHDLISGGFYGLEGSVLATVIGVVGVALVVLLGRRQQMIDLRTGLPLDQSRNAGTTQLTAN